MWCTCFPVLFINSECLSKLPYGGVSNQIISWLLGYFANQCIGKPSVPWKYWETFFKLSVSEILHTLYWQKYCDTPLSHWIQAFQWYGIRCIKSLRHVHCVYKHLWKNGLLSGAQQIQTYSCDRMPPKMLIHEGSSQLNVPRPTVSGIITSLIKWFHHIRKYLITWEQQKCNHRMGTVCAEVHSVQNGVMNLTSVWQSDGQVWGWRLPGE